MSGNRKAFTDYVYKEYLRAGQGDDTNAKYIKEKLESLTDVQFEALVVAIEEGKAYLPFFMPNDVDNRLAIEEWIAQAEELGAKLFTTLRVEDPATGSIYHTNEKYWVGLMNDRRMTQHLNDKRSLPKDNKSRDVLTGQVAGASKGSSLSPSQTALITGRGLTANAYELANARGGDIAASREFNRALMEEGNVSLESIAAMNSAPEVNNVLASYLDAMHIANNINRNQAQASQ